MPPLGWSGVKIGGRSGKTVATVPWTLGTVIRKAVNVDKPRFNKLEWQRKHRALHPMTEVQRKSKKESDRKYRLSRAGVTVDRKEYQRRYRALNPMTDAQRMAKKMSDKKYRLSAPEHVKESLCLAKIRWRKNNPSYMKNYYLANGTRIREKNKKWGLANRTSVIERARHRCKTDPAFRLVKRLRARIYKALCGKSKSATTFNLLGCSLTDFRRHLELQFKPGMTWENYGPIWHVDHIRPCASFDFSEVEQQYQCFHYTNLQPLFALDNFSKGSKYVSE